MKVSIITATYNSSKTILDTLKSVSSQTYANIEHLIIDGLSKDDTLKVVSNFSGNPKIISEKDNGIYDAMNKGITNSTGDIIGILNSDDYYSNEFIIEKVVKLFETTNCDLLYGDLVFIDENDKSKIKRVWKSGEYKHKDFLYGWMPPHPTFFVKKGVYEKYGLFNLNLGSAADYELMLRFMYKFKLKTSYLNEILVHFRIGGASTKNFKARIKANQNDKQAWKANKLKNYWFTTILKPARKIIQFKF